MKKIILFSLILVSAIAQDYVYKKYDIEMIRQALQIPEKEKQLLGTRGGVAKVSNQFLAHTHQQSDSQIIDTIRHSVAANKWTGKASIQIEEKFLHVVQQQDVHNELQNFLQHIKKQFLQTVYVEIEVVELGQNQTIYQESTELCIGQNHNIAIVTNHSFVTDYDVEVAEGSATADPVMSEFREGFALQLLPFLSFDREFVYLFGGVEQVQLDGIENLSPKDMSALGLPQSQESGSYGTFRVPVAKKSLLTYYTINNKVYAIYVTINKEKESLGLSNVNLYDGGLLYYLLSTPDYTNKDFYSNPSMGVVLVESSKKGAFFDENVVTQQQVNRYQQICKKFLGKHLICGRMIVSSSPEIAQQLKKIEQLSGNIYNAHIRIYEIPTDKYKQVVQQRNITKKQHEVLREYTVKSLHLSGVQNQKSCNYSYMNHRILNDYDVEVATKAYIGDPMTRDVVEGVQACIQVEKSEEFWCDIHLEKSSIIKPIATVKTPHGPIHVPKVSHVLLQQKFRLIAGQERIVKGFTKGEVTTLFTIECE